MNPQHYRVTLSNGTVREYPATCGLAELRRYIRGTLRLYPGKVLIASITRRDGGALIPL